jgi:hypothetical protein
MKFIMISGVGGGGGGGVESFSEGALVVDQEVIEGGAVFGAAAIGDVGNTWTGTGVARLGGLSTLSSVSIASLGASMGVRTVGPCSGQGTGLVGAWGTTPMFDGSLVMPETKLGVALMEWGVVDGESVKVTVGLA